MELIFILKSSRGWKFQLDQYRYVRPSERNLRVPTLCGEREQLYRLHCQIDFGVLRTLYDALSAMHVLLDLDWCVSPTCHLY